MNLQDDIDINRYILSSPITAYRINNLLTSSHPLVNLDVLRENNINLVQIPAEKSCFGFTIPYMPVQINSIELLSTNDFDKLSEILNQYTQFVGNLSKWLGSAFSIRYIHDPMKQKIKIVLLGRVTTVKGQSKSIAEEISRNIEYYLETVMSFPYKRVTSEEELNSLLEPFQELEFLEILPGEQLVDAIERNDIGEEICHPLNIICPFDRPKDATWLKVFERINIENEPVVINIHIEPTKLFDIEDLKLREAIDTVKGYVNYKITRNLTSKEVEDPINEAIANNYYRRWKSLRGPENPVLEIIQIACRNSMTGFEIAKLFSQEITNSKDFNDTTTEKHAFPSGYQIFPCIKSDKDTALKTFKELDIFPRSFIDIDMRGRARYLTDLVSASAAFRFPVSVRKGISGINTKIPLEGMNIYYDNPVKSGNTILLGQTLGSNAKDIGIPLDYFSKHILVAGNTGTGKTNTCLQIVGELWKKNIPSLIIEPVNPQYRTLIKDYDTSLSHNIQVYTLGNESISPFRLNPFELLPGIRIEEHLSQIAMCFHSIFPQFAALPTIIQDSLINIYSNKGWKLSDTLQNDDKRTFPTLGDFFIECLTIAQAEGYSKEIKENIVAAVSVRLRTLLVGSKGFMLNTNKSISITQLMEKPTILELNSLNNDERALMMTFLMVFIREFAQTRERQNDQLMHVTIIEEAHRVMGIKSQNTNIEISSDVSGNANKIFSEIISEIRWFGEGIIICDQIPSRLVEDAHKNTNSKIIHKLGGEDDRIIVSNTMNANEKQIRDLSRLEIGQAAFFTENMDGPTYIQVRNYQEEHHLPGKLSDQDVKNHMLSQDHSINVLLPFLGCKYCKAICNYREQVMTKAYQIGIAKVIEESKDNIENTNFINIIQEIRNVLKQVKLEKDFNAVFCFFSHVVDSEISESTYKRLLWQFELTQNKER